MRGVKVQRVGGDDAIHKMVAVLAVSFGVLVATILMYSNEIVAVTGYSALPELYGGFAPLFLVICVIVLIFVYKKTVEK